LPGKNIKDFLGDPLVARPIMLAKKSDYIDKIVVSTDSHEIAKVAREYGSDVSMRPDDISGDTAVVADVVRYTLDELQKEGETFDYVILLEATSPMRDLDIINTCIEKLDDSNIDSVATFSVADPPPTRIWKIEKDIASPFIEGADPWLPRQKQVEGYYLNGLVYIFRVETFLHGSSNTLFVGNGAAVVTDVHCVDIDTLEDFELAETLLGK